MEKSEGEAAKVLLTASSSHAERRTGRPPRSSSPSSSSSSLLARAFGLPSTGSVIDGVIVLPLSKQLRVALPPLLISSLPKRAIGFSFPRGGEGKVLGVALLLATATLSYMLDRAFGAFAAIGIVWLTGGTSALILYNSTRRGLAFVKEMCSTCRLRPIIEEHEVMHLKGEGSEEAVWRETRRKYTYEGLGLGTDPRIHGFCPIAARLKESS